ncbi:MAG: TetR/AcrR family transcriptional regulator [Microbacteriaceae bacterium]
MSSHEELRRIALEEFAHVGYAATSLQQVADRAGLSKSSVLYHFASKEALLEAAVGPAVDDMEKLLTGLIGNDLSTEVRESFVQGFVDFALAHRLEINTFLGQGLMLVDVPVIDRANRLVDRLAEFFCTAAPTVEGQLRFGIALGGSAYILGTQPGRATTQTFADDEIRVALITIMTQLLSPVSVHRTTT